MAIEIKQLPAEDIERIVEIDRSEEVKARYWYRDGTLVKEEVDWQVPNFPLEGSEDFSIQGNLKHWRPILADGGVLVGALDGERLAGLVIFYPNLTEEMGQLAALYVSRTYRGQGIGQALVGACFGLAETHGVGAIYVSSIPSKHSVDFYCRQGFKPTDTPHPALFALEPEDVHMIKDFSG